MTLLDRIRHWVLAAIAGGTIPEPEPQGPIPKINALAITAGRIDASRITAGSLFRYCTVEHPFEPHRPQVDAVLAECDFEFCLPCDRELAAGVRYCPECGAEVVSA